MVIKLILTIIVLILSWITYNAVYYERILPDIELDEWWGPGNKKNLSTTVRRFKIEWSKEMISDLKYRLSTRRQVTLPLEGINFEYGFNSIALEPILEYWHSQYNFTARLQYLNQFPQYKTNIQGLDIHFIWVKPKVKVKVVPLLLLHGWPGSVREFYEAIPLLTQPRPGYEFVFEVVVPSLPGLGYSDAALRRGLGATKMAVVMRNLMHRLGYQQFYLQGGDWGSYIGSLMSTVFPKEVLGYHTNMPITSDPVYFMKLIIGSFVPWIVSPSASDRLYPLSNLVSLYLEETGYFHVQATKPYTIGVGLTDSPVGLAAYILEKFSTATDVSNRHTRDGGLSAFRTDDLLDNLMVYWHSGSITTSLMLYSNFASLDNIDLVIDRVPTSVPTWALHTSKEPLYFPISLMTHKYTNVLEVTQLNNGGHFAAFEIPTEFTSDIFRAVKTFIEYHENKKVK